VKVGGSLGSSDHEMVEFRMLRGGSRPISRITTLDFRRADFGLFKDLLGGIPWARALEGRGVQESWSLDVVYLDLIFGEATEGEGFWSRGSRRGTLSPVAKPQLRGGKKRRERVDLSPSPAPERESGRCQRAAALTQRGRSRV